MITFHFGKKEKSYILPRKVDAYEALFQNLRRFVERTFGVSQFRMAASIEKSQFVDEGDDLEAEIEELQGLEFHMEILVKLYVRADHMT